MTKLTSPSRPRVLFVGNSSTGIYNFRLEVIKYLQSKGFDVAVLAPKDFFTPKIVSEGVSFTELKLNLYSKNPILEARTILQLIYLYRKIKPDFIFHYTIKPNIYGSLAASFVKTKSIISITGLGQLFNFGNVILQRMVLFFYKKACNNSDMVWFLNESDRNVFLEKGLVDIEKTEVLPSEGVNTSHYKPQKRDEVKNDYTRFLFVGRMLWEKGITEFVEAARIIQQDRKDTRFEILGLMDTSNPNAVSFDNIKAWESEGIVNYLGESPDVRPYIAACDCVVFPSFYREGMSRVLLEAGAMEKPIITTDNVGCKEAVLKDRSALIVKTRNIGDLVEKINTFLSLSEDDRSLMGRQGRKYVVENFDQSIINQIYLEALEHYLKKIES